MEPLKLNQAQRYVHERLEDKLFELGMVRALILKGRQQGISTYVEGRYYWKTRFRKAVKAFILTHLQQATEGSVNESRSRKHYANFFNFLGVKVQNEVRVSPRQPEHKS